MPVRWPCCGPNPDGDIVYANGGWPSMLDDTQRAARAQLALGPGARARRRDRHPRPGLDQLPRAVHGAGAHRRPRCRHRRLRRPGRPTRPGASCAWRPCSARTARTRASSPRSPTCRPRSPPAPAPTAWPGCSRPARTSCMIAERNGAISYVNDAAQQTLGVRGSTVGRHAELPHGRARRRLVRGVPGGRRTGAGGRRDLAGRAHVPGRGPARRSRCRRCSSPTRTTSGGSSRSRRSPATSPTSRTPSGGSASSRPTTT